MRKLLFLAFFFELGCCGYKLGRNAFDNYQSIAIPLASGDIHGVFTSALTQKIKERSAITLSSCSPELLLKIALTPPFEENLDYRFAEGEKGEPRRFVVPVGALLKESAVVEIIDLQSGVKLLGPIDVKAYLIFDFKSDFSELNFHNFSLSELEMYEIACDEALYRLHHLLAEKVVDALLYCW